MPEDDLVLCTNVALDEVVAVVGMRARDSDGADLVELGGNDGSGSGLWRRVSTALMQSMSREGSWEGVELGNLRKKLERVIPARRARGGTCSLLACRRSSRLITSCRCSRCRQSARRGTRCLVRFHERRHRRGTCYRTVELGKLDKCKTVVPTAAAYLVFVETVDPIFARVYVNCHGNGGFIWEPASVGHGLADFDLRYDCAWTWISGGILRGLWMQPTLSYVHGVDIRKLGFVGRNAAIVVDIRPTTR